jgi:exodeoxyribonuclease VII small subunit
MAAKKVSQAKNDLGQFENTLMEIQQIVAKMEEGKLSLEESLAYFERGIKLTRECQKALESAQQKVEILLKENGKEKLKQFNTDDDEST